MMMMCKAPAMHSARSTMTFRLKPSRKTGGNKQDCIYRQQTFTVLRNCSHYYKDGDVIICRVHFNIQQHKYNEETPAQLRSLSAEQPAEEEHWDG